MGHLRCTVLLASWLIGLRASGIQGTVVRSSEAPLSNAFSDHSGDENNGLVSFSEFSGDAEKYEDVIEELEQQSGYQAARDRNDEIAEERKQRINKSLKRKSASKPKSGVSADTPSEATKKKYDAVLDELQQQPEYQAARRRNDEGAEERRLRVNELIKDDSNNPSPVPFTDPSKPNEATKTKYDKVLEELQKQPQYLAAKKRIDAQTH